MSEQVSKIQRFWSHEARNIRCVRESDYDALHAEAEALRAENWRLQSACDHNKTCAQVANELADELAAELEAARGLLRECRDTVSLAHDLAETQVEGEKYSALGWRIIAFLTATPAPEVRTQHAGRQEAVHWRAVLDPAEVPMQLNPHEHIAGFTDRRKAEDWIAARLCMDGWHYTLEPLYTAPPPAQDVSGLVEELEQVRMNDSESARHGIGATYWNNAVIACQCAIRDMAGHRQAQRPGQVNRCPTCTSSCPEICAKARP